MGFQLAQKLYKCIIQFKRYSRLTLYIYFTITQYTGFNRCLRVLRGKKANNDSSNDTAGIRFLLRLV